MIFKRFKINKERNYTSMSFGISKAVIEVPITAPHTREEFNKENELFPLTRALMDAYNINDAYSFMYATLPFYDEINNLPTSFEVGEDNVKVEGEIDLVIFRSIHVKKEQTLVGIKYTGQCRGKDIVVELNKFNMEYKLNGKVILPFNLIYCGDTNNMVCVALRDKDNNITKQLLKGATQELEENRMTK